MPSTYDNTDPRLHTNAFIAAYFKRYKRMPRKGHVDKMLQKFGEK